MDCSEFLTRIEALTDGTLSADAQMAADRHRAVCQGCRELAEVMSVGREILSEGLPAGLAESILERTSGRPCARAREHLGYYVDQTLGGVDRDLLRGHLDHCGDCAALVGVLTRLANHLPELAELAPDAGFTGDVMAATAARERSWVPAGESWWQGLLGRSRLAWEAGYVGAIALWLVFGASWAPLRATSERAIAIVQENHVRSVVETVKSTVRRDDAGALWDRLRSSLGRE